MEEIGGVILSSILSVVMCKRYYDTQKIMPAGLVGGLSVIMSLFFVYRLINPAKIPQKKKK